MERKASDYRRGRPGIDGLTPTEDPVAHEPMEKEPDKATNEDSRAAAMEGHQIAKGAVDALVAEGITRERAEQLVATHGTDWATLKQVAWPEGRDTSSLADDKGR